MLTKRYIGCLFKFFFIFVLFKKYIFVFLPVLSEWKQLRLLNTRPRKAFLHFGYQVEKQGDIAAIALKGSRLHCFFFLALPQGCWLSMTLTISGWSQKRENSSFNKYLLSTLCQVLSWQADKTPSMCNHNLDF